MVLTINSRRSSKYSIGGVVLVTTAAGALLGFGFAGAVFLRVPATLLPLLFFFMMVVFYRGEQGSPRFGPRGRVVPQQHDNGAVQYNLRLAEIRMTDINPPVTDTAPAAKTTLDINEIMRILPHRFPFLLIDRVIDLKRRQRIVAIKNVTVNEPFFTGHFPNMPIMPGVLIVEAIAQAGGALLLTEFDEEIRAQKLMVFTGIERARFRRPVLPGDQVRIEVAVKEIGR